MLDPHRCCSCCPNWVSFWGCAVPCPVWKRCFQGLLPGALPVGAAQHGAIRTAGAQMVVLSQLGCGFNDPYITGIYPFRR